MRAWFRPGAHRVVSFDQRACGASTPHAGDPDTDLAAVTADRLVDDLEQLRAHLGVDRWLVAGHSWGTTLALAYAEQHPDRVRGLVLVGVTTTSRREIDWLYRDLAAVLPAEWERFVAGVPDGDRADDLVAAYHRVLEGPDPAARQRAADAWCEWDLASVSVDPDAPWPVRYADPRFRRARARLCAHVFHREVSLHDGRVLADAGRLARVPGTMVQGRLDLQAPLRTAWELARRWPDGELVVVPGAGHATGDPGMVDAARAATDELADAP
jgi:proline iminopeptidase